MPAPWPDLTGQTERMTTMETIARNPTKGIYPATPDYVHALEVRNPARFLYVAGTMGLDESGAAGSDPMPRRCRTLMPARWLD